jgi:hypothetical protein
MAFIKNTVYGKFTIDGATGPGATGATVLNVEGTQGVLFKVIDGLTGSLMSVNNISGLPVLEVFSDNRVVMGTFGDPAMIVSGSNVLIGGPTGATGVSTPGAILEIQSTTQSVLFPRVTTSQKTAISGATGGMVVFDTTLQKLCVYTNAGWETITSA